MSNSVHGCEIGNRVSDVSPALEGCLVCVGFVATKAESHQELTKRVPRTASLDCPNRRDRTRDTGGITVVIDA